MRNRNLQDIITLDGLYLKGAGLSHAWLQGATLSGARLEQADLRYAQLRRANLNVARLQGTYLYRAQLERAVLVAAQLNGETSFDDASFGMKVPSQLRILRRLWPFWEAEAVALGDIRWTGVGNVDLTRITDWEPVQRLGDEREVSWRDGASKHEAVARAYRQVVTQLRAQGMTEVADRFSYRALIFQRRADLRRLRLFQYLGSLFLWVFGRPWLSSAAHHFLVCCRHQ